MTFDVIGIAGRMGVGKDTLADLYVRRNYVRVAHADPLKQLARHLFGFTEETLFGPSDSRNRLDPRGYSPVYWETVFHRTHHPMIEKLFPTVERTRVTSRLQEVITAIQYGPFSARSALQFLGTEFGRSLDPEVWVKALHRLIDGVAEGRVYDKALGLISTPTTSMLPQGVVVPDVRFRNEVTAIEARGGVVYWLDAAKRVPNSDQFAHASETTQEALGLTRIFDNNGTIAELEQQIDQKG